MEELLNRRHPFEAQHQAQQALLRSPPEPMRADRAHLRRLGNAAFRYQQQAEGMVTGEDFTD